MVDRLDHFYPEKVMVFKFASIFMVHIYRKFLRVEVNELITKINFLEN